MSQSWEWSGVNVSPGPWHRPRWVGDRSRAACSSPTLSQTCEHLRERLNLIAEDTKVSDRLMQCDVRLKSGASLDRVGLDFDLAGGNVGGPDRPDL